MGNCCQRIRWGRRRFFGACSSSQLASVCIFQSDFITLRTRGNAKERQTWNKCQVMEEDVEFQHDSPLCASFATFA